MRIIPVLDLKDGQVVHAVRGQRSEYQPIHVFSRLTDSSEIDAVLAGFLRLYPFKQFYIADLNAICGDGHHQGLIEALLQANPDIEFWLDNGCQLSEIGPAPSNQRWVIGTETQRSQPATVPCECVLSLDFKQERLLGHDAWLRQTAYWPDRLIVMTLSRVGSQMGPDIETLIALQQAHPDKFWVAAGGVRHPDDLLLLKTKGVHAVLMATALHDGSINARDLQNL